MKFFGAHVSAEPDVSFCPLYAHKLGAKAFAMFTAPDNSFRPVKITAEVAEAFREACKQYAYSPEMILPHAGFMFNAATNDKRKHLFAVNMLRNELDCAASLGLTMVNFHPGSTLGVISDEQGIVNIADTINRALDKTTGVTAVVENMAGQGSVLGRSLSQLEAIIDRVEDKTRIGVCIDTCHAFAAGYDIATHEGFESFVSELDNTVGLKYLRGMHLNDSQRKCNSHIDRHESLGCGHIGAEAFRLIATDPRFDSIPLILETPDADKWRDEIARLEDWARQSSQITS